MYINVKKRDNKYSETVLYLYICKSNRIEGRVKNVQKYVGSIREQDLHKYKSILNNKLDELCENERFMVYSKIENLREKVIV